ncbi:MAG: hypothetical protein COB46_06005 [Rhodospirillaceae bacterium]|nr:MAG: hypothetical protein COB46_06005 [Rhodospirillaceae bacterium]
MEQSDGQTKPVFDFPTDAGSFVVDVGGQADGTVPREASQDLSEGTLTQTSRDFLLAQIFKFWNYNYNSPSGQDITLHGYVTVMPDGMLAPPFNGAQRWNPQEAMPQYAEAERTNNTIVTRALESFYLALRMSQPLKLPENPSESWPQRVSVSFNFKDLPTK